MGSHATALQSQGVDQDTVDAVGTNHVDEAGLSPKDRALLKYVKILTLEPAKTKDADVQALRDAGWTDEQIWEASLETSFFAFFNRMADAYGLDYPKSGWKPPAIRSSTPSVNPGKPVPQSPKGKAAGK